MTKRKKKINTEGLEKVHIDKTLLDRSGVLMQKVFQKISDAQMKEFWKKYGKKKD